MPKQKDIHKILIIGSGPLIIGQGEEYDCFGTQACQALRGRGYEVVTADADPAAVMTDPDRSDVTYIEPLNTKVITEIIAAERPDALLTSLGGQSALNLGIELEKSGVLREFGVKIIGTGADAVRLCQDRDAFKKTMSDLGIETPRSRTVHSAEEAQKAAEDLGCPLVIHPAFAIGGTGGELLYNMEDIPEAAARGISASLVGQIMVEESLLGWDELEAVLLRDAENHISTVCCVENIDPAGVHTGDSICVIPMMGVSHELRTKIENQAHAIAGAIAPEGLAVIQFAHDPGTGRLVVIEVNPRASRTAALAAKAAGLPLGAFSALLSCGLRMDEIPDLKKWKDSGDCGFRGQVTVKFPRWDFGRFPKSEDRLGIRMQSSGEVMGIGRTFAEALQKAVRSLDADRCGLGFAGDYDQKTADELLNMLGKPSSQNMFILYGALRKGADISVIQEKTRIRPLFIAQIKEMLDLENEILRSKRNLPDDDLLIRAKKAGFADRYLSRVLEIPERQIRQRREAMKLFPARFAVGGDESGRRGYYFSYAEKGNGENNRGKKRSILIAGSGPHRIARSREFDHCCIQAVSAVRDAGYAALMHNCNPASVTTDPAMSDALFFEPLTAEDILNIAQQEKPDGVILQFSGKCTMDMEAELERAGIRVFGSVADAMRKTGDREGFRQIVRKLGFPRLRSGRAAAAEEILKTADDIGYPVFIRSEVAAHPAAEVFMDQKSLRDWLALSPEIHSHKPVFIEEFLKNAIGAEALAVSDGSEVFVAGVAEHVERAGVHSGDSTLAVPPLMLSHLQLDIIRDYARGIALELHVSGLLSVRYAIAGDTVYMLEAEIGASRTVPLISKVCRIPLARMAVQIMLGKTLSDLNPRQRNIPHFSVRKAVFPFDVFPETDPLPGPEMRSTGQALGLSDSFGRAFFKAWEACGIPLPLEGTVLITVADQDKSAALEPARLFREMGFRILATRGTRQFLSENGIESDLIKKMGYGRPNITDAIKNGEIDLVINTPGGRQSQEDDSYIRKASVRYRVPNITTAASALTAAKGIAARRKGKPRVRPLQKYDADNGEL
ncbi:MAG: carbamoyl-phosphate synthase large subunit [Desulfococcaceae bacterium]